MVMFCIRCGYEDLARELKIEEFGSTPITVKNVIIWDDGKSTKSPVNMLNAIWTITINEILKTNDSKKIPKLKDIAKRIKR